MHLFLSDSHPSSPTVASKILSDRQPRPDQMPALRDDRHKTSKLFESQPEHGGIGRPNPTAFARMKKYNH
jgi:hypothetical protein